MWAWSLVNNFSLATLLPKILDQPLKTLGTLDSTCIMSDSCVYITTWMSALYCKELKKQVARDGNAKKNSNSQGGRDDNECTKGPGDEAMLHVRSEPPHCLLAIRFLYWLHERPRVALRHTGRVLRHTGRFKFSPRGWFGVNPVLYSSWVSLRITGFMAVDQGATRTALIYICAGRLLNVGPVRCDQGQKRSLVTRPSYFRSVLVMQYIQYCGSRRVWLRD